MRGYDSLSAEHRAVYAEIVSLLFSHSERLLLWGRLRTAELEQLHTMVMCDYPEIFWVSGYSCHLPPHLQLHRRRGGATHQAIERAA